MDTSPYLPSLFRHFFFSLFSFFVMKSVEVIGFKRANLGKKEAKAVREEGMVPCVMYGGAESVHFAVPTFLFRDLIYTPEARMVDLNVEGKHYKAVLQDAQFHPVNESILHADFLELNESKELKMEIPIRMVGTSIGVIKGGKIAIKMRKLKVQALPANMPEFVDVQISDLDLGKSVKVSSIATDNFKILNPKSNPVVTVVIPRALKGKQAAE
jgi:large subunit ribosomal protein L25